MAESGAGVAEPAAGVAESGAGVAPNGSAFSVAISAAGVAEPAAAVAEPAAGVAGVAPDGMAESGVVLPSPQPAWASLGPALPVALSPMPKLPVHWPEAKLEASCHMLSPCAMLQIYTRACDSLAAHRTSIYILFLKAYLGREARWQ